MAKALKISVVYGQTTKNTWSKFWPQWL